MKEKYRWECNFLQDTPLAICGRRVVVYLGICLFGGCVRYLSSFHVHRIIIFVDQILYSDQFIALFFECGDHLIQGLGSMFGTVVAEDDGAVAQMLVIAHLVYDRGGIVVLPVQTVHILNTWIQLILEALQYMDKKGVHK